MILHVCLWYFPFDGTICVGGIDGFDEMRDETRMLSVACVAVGATLH